VRSALYYINPKHQEDIYISIRINPSKLLVSSSLLSLCLSLAVAVAVTLLLAVAVLVAVAVRVSAACLPVAAAEATATTALDSLGVASRSSATGCGVCLGRGLESS
jgi:hypothetical protein